jgi:hypothetical protein
MSIKKSQYRERILQVLAIFLLCGGASLCAVSAGPEKFRIDGTTGTPLGGVGTGAVKYCAWTGILNAFTDMTPAGMQRYNKHVTLGKGARFQFWSDRDGKVIKKDTLKVPCVNGRFSDDAVFPVHMADYGLINGIKVNMTGFCPWDPGDFNSMCMPYAFFEFALENTADKPIKAAIALMISYGAKPVIIPGKGISDESGPHRKAVFVKSDNPVGILSAGIDEGFFRTGLCDNVINDTTCRVALKVHLKGKESAKIRFVLAWYKDNEYGKYFYENLHSGVGTIAEEGMAKFESFRNNAVTFVHRLRGSNIPIWMTTYLSNVLCNMVNNSVYTKDGRACMAEGEFNTLGTIDEYWQGRNIIGSNLMPVFTWKELEYWARTQYQEPYLGQIHHDFGVRGHGTSDADLCAWDDHSHQDYRPLDDVVSWPDENVGFIVGVYESFIATDDHEKLRMLWPYLKNTGNRLLVQIEQYGDKNIPWTFETSHNMYDAGGYCQSYSTGSVIPAFRCLVFMAEVMNDPEVTSTFLKAEAECIKGFSSKYLESEYSYIDKHCEGALAGPWFSRNMKFDQFDCRKTDKYIFNVLERFYKPLTDSMGYPAGTYNEWPQHITGHFGGYALQSSNPGVMLALWKDMYNRGYIDRNRVFNLPITLQPKAKTVKAATSIDGYLQYTSRTSTWRIYQDMVGYYRNKHTGEIWLEPVILPEMNHEMKNAFYTSAEGYGTVSCIESGQANEDRLITFKPDMPVEIKGIYIKDHPGTPVIKVNGKKQTWTRTGPEWNKRILINWKGLSGEKGLEISVYH